MFFPISRFNDAAPIGAEERVTVDRVATRVSASFNDAAPIGAEELTGTPGNGTPAKVLQ